MEYSTMFMLLAVASGFALFGIFLSHLVMPKKPNSIKNATYECGNEPTGDAKVRYNIRFYVFALVYVVFAVEGGFLFPWAVVFKSIPGLLPLFEVLVFLAILALALAYAWNKGALEWD
jgi:NADH-quinone oxidoreductase subunit A